MTPRNLQLLVGMNLSRLRVQSITVQEEDQNQDIVIQNAMVGGSGGLSTELVTRDSYDGWLRSLSSIRKG